MKNYQKAEMIAKNLPTGSYAAGCPEHTHTSPGICRFPDGTYRPGCHNCEVAQ